MLEIPLHSFAHARLERFCRPPAEFALCLASVNRITPVMAGAIGDESNQFAVRAFTRCEFVQQRAQGMNNINIRFLVPATDVIGFTETAGLQYAPQGTAMVADVQPVAHLLTITIDRQRLARERIGNDEWDQFLGELQRSVVIRAVAGNDRQTIGVMPGAHEMIRCRLGCRVRAVRCIRRGLGKRCVVRTQTTEDFIRGYMQKTKCGFVRVRQSGQIGARRFEQAEGTIDIGSDEITRAMNRTINVAFGCKMHDGAWTVLFQQRGYQRAIADITLHKDMTGIAGQGGKIGRITGIGQLIQVDHGLIAGR